MPLRRPACGTLVVLGLDIERYPFLVGKPTRVALSLAARLRQIAEMETVGRMRDQLLSLAEQYDQLARNLQPSTAKAGALEDS